MGTKRRVNVWEGVRPVLAVEVPFTSAVIIKVVAVGTARPVAAAAPDVTAVVLAEQIL